MKRWPHTEPSAPPSAYVVVSASLPVPGLRQGTAIPGSSTQFSVFSQEDFCVQRILRPASHHLHRNS